MKRCFDLALALFLAIPAAIVILCLLPIVALDTRASPLFLQVRYGKAGKNFTLVKLRTMRPDAPNAASHAVSAHHITSFGKLSRSCKLDELPQIWNVIMGDMSFVGPRPCLPTQHEVIDARERTGANALRPGITGPAQVQGIDMSTPERLAQADATYLMTWSLARDLRLLAATAGGGGRGDAIRR